MQIDFSAAFDMVNDWVFSISSALRVLEVLCCLYREFLSNRSQHVMVDGCQRKLVILSGVLQGSFFEPVIVFPVHLGAFVDSGRFFPFFSC